MKSLEDIINKIIDRRITPSAIICKVVSVDKDTATAKLEAVLDGQKIEGARLSAISGKPTTDLIVYPKVGSSCIALSLNKSQEEYVIVSVSDYDEIRSEDGSNGGLLKGDDTVAELNKLKAQVEGLLNTIAAWAPAPGDGGSKLKVDLTAAGVFTLPGSNFSNVQNSKVKI